jgi:hypothetical protein
MTSVLYQFGECSFVGGPRHCDSVRSKPPRFEVAPDHWPNSDRRQSLAGSLAIGLWNNKGKSNSTCHWNFVVWTVQKLRQGHYILCT